MTEEKQPEKNEMTPVQLVLLIMIVAGSIFMFLMVW